MMVSGETKFDLALAAIKVLSNTAATPIVVLAQIHLEARLFHAFCFSIISSGITRAITPPRAHYTTNYNHYTFMSPSQSHASHSPSQPHSHRAFHRSGHSQKRQRPTFTLPRFASAGMQFVPGSPTGLVFSL